MKSVLNADQARIIFDFKSSDAFQPRYSASSFLAKKFHVSPKAIRDIWAGRSWLSATHDMWKESCRPVPNKPGRPRGSKDKKPRKLKSLSGLEGSNRIKLKITDERNNTGSGRVEDEYIMKNDLIASKIDVTQLVDPFRDNLADLIAASQLRNVREFSEGVKIQVNDNSVVADRMTLGNSDLQDEMNLRCLFMTSAMPFPGCGVPLSLIGTTGNYRQQDKFPLSVPLPSIHLQGSQPVSPPAALAFLTFLSDPFPSSGWSFRLSSSCT